jgi:hypothetical protein
MAEACENLALLTESLPEEARHKGKVNQFDGDLLIELTVGAMREIDSPHTSTPDQTV